MREFLRRGGRDRPGLDELARRVAERRRELLRRHRPRRHAARRCASCSTGASLDERKQLARDLGRRRRAFAEMQHRQPAAQPGRRGQRAGRLRLAQPRGAASDYEQIKDLLGRELLDQRFAGMKQALENATDEDRAAVKRDARATSTTCWTSTARGEDTERRTSRVHGPARRLLPREPADDRRADRRARPARRRPPSGCCNSMTPEQREELMQLSQQAFGSPELMEQLARLDDNLQGAAPGRGLGRLGGLRGRAGPRPRRRDRRPPGPRRPRRARRPARPVLPRCPDGRRRPRRAGPPARRRGGGRAPGRCAELEQALRDSGYLKRGSDGAAPALAPRRCASSARRCCATSPTGCRRGRASATSGRPGPPASRAARPGQWEFGDTEPWDVDPHDHQRRRPHGRRRHGPAPRGAARHRATSRSPRPRPAPRRRSRCSSTPRSRWRWTAAGCR